MRVKGPVPQMQSCFGQGFSLLEVLVAMGISSLLYIGAYGVLDSVLTTNEVVVENTEKIRSLQRVIHFIQRDVEQIIARPIRDQYGETLAALSYGFVSDNGFQFTKLGWRNPIHRQRSDLQRVAYLVEDEVLIRRHWLILDQDYDTEAKDSEMLHGVSEFKLRFYDQENKAWVDSWPTDKLLVKSLPRMVEMILMTKNFGEIKRVFRIVDSV